MILPSLQVGLWGLLAGAALIVGAAAAWFVQVPGRLIAGVMAFEQTHNAAGLITVTGFFAAFVLSKLEGCGGASCCDAQAKMETVG
jgi:hypothetical protein